MNHLTHFLHMGGYGFYVWSAYGIATFALVLQWWQPWRDHS
jgi:heme exporter protein CcmD